MKCIICNQEIKGYPNNAEPVKKGCCCDNCNMTVVIPARLKQAKNLEEKNFKEAVQEKIRAKIIKCEQTLDELNKLEDSKKPTTKAYYDVQDKMLYNYYKKMILSNLLTDIESM